MRDIEGAKSALEHLKMYPDIAAAMESDEPDKVYRLLERKRAGARPEDKQLYDRVLSERRLFLMPLGSAPTMTTINGIGTRLCGTSERDPEDGSHISTLCFCILFVPIFPIREYLVRSEGGSRYMFFGRVPPDKSFRAWKRWVSLFSVVLAVGAALGIAESRIRSDVQFVNGLPIAVAMTIDGKKQFEVGPLARHTERLLGENHRLLVKIKDQVIDDRTIAVPGGTDVVAYNVLGAAPLYSMQIVYASEDKPPPPEPIPVDYAGQTWIVLDNVDDVFEDPPKSVSLPSPDSRVTRTQFALADGGWKTAVYFLTSSDHDKAAGLLTGEVAMVLGPDREVAEQAGDLLIRAGAFSELEALGDRLISVLPSEYWTHRLRQNAFLFVGRRKEVLADYEARLAEADESDRPLYGALVSRLESNEDAVRRLGPLAEANPDVPYLQSGLAFRHHQLLQAKEAVAVMERLFEIDPEATQQDSSDYVADLVRIGRTDDAVAFLEKSLENIGPTATPNLVLYEELMVSLGRPVDPSYRRELSAKAPWINGYVEARFGRVSEPDLAAVKDKTLARAWTIDATCVGDPDAALEAIDEAPKTVRRALSYDIVLAAMGEWCARGQHDKASELANDVGMPPATANAAMTFVETGKTSFEIEAFDPIGVGILMFARGRKIGGADGDALIAEAKERDVLGGFLSMAASRWPAPTR